MRPNFVRIALAASITLFIQAEAHAGNGLYAGAGLGYSNSPDTTANGTSGGKVRFDASTMGSAFVGYDTANNWRFEGELSRRAAGMNKVAGATASGEALATSVMANVIYDLNIDTVLKPYVGLGAGYASIKLNNATPFGGSTIDDSGTAGAAQAIVGASYALNDRVSLFSDYRYFKTGKADFTTNAGVGTSMDFSAHSLMVGLTYSFGGDTTQKVLNMDSAEQASLSVSSDIAGNSSQQQAQEVSPAPTIKMAEAKPQEMAAMPVARVAPSDAYVVYFKLNKADLTAASKATLKRAAADVMAQKLIKIDLTAHTDTPGDAAYNMDLSRRRGEAVKAELVKLGFQASDISVRAMGETNLPIPTPDNKYEPKNRRVEIILP